MGDDPVDTRDIGMYLPYVCTSYSLERRFDHTPSLSRFRAALGYQGPVPLRMLCSNIMKREIRTGLQNPVSRSRPSHLSQPTQPHILS